MHFYRITNADGKQWVMPSHNMAMGMLLYQPSAWKGYALKKWFPLINRLDVGGVARKALHIETCSNPISDTLQQLLCKVFQEKDLEYSIFNGTPCAHQKVTIQVYKDDKILGYCKVTDKPELIDIFQREESYLQWLAACNVSGVPSCLCCQELTEGTWVFVQSTTKSKTSIVRHSLGHLELGFLKQLSDHTKVNIPFTKTDMSSWLKRMEQTPIGKNPEIKDAIQTVRDYFSQTERNRFSAFHSDFTPWNMFVEDKKLFVFDWEYAGRTYIPYLDIIHYLIQTSVFETKLDAQGIYDILFVKNKDLLSQYFLNPRVAVLSYLLDIMAKYAIRDEGHETADTENLKNERLGLLSLVIKQNS